MSLCYDIQRWTIISLALVTVSLTIGLLIQYAHGFVDGNNNGKDDVQETLDSNQTNNVSITFSMSNPLKALFSSTNFSSTNFSSINYSNLYSIDIPDNWTYKDYLFGMKTLTPSEFGVLLLKNSLLDEPLNEKMKDGGAYASFQPDSEFDIKNAGFDLYVKYKIDKQDSMNVTAKQNVTIDNEPAVKVYGDGIDSLNGTKFVEYMVWHDKQPYYIGYMASVKDYQKYLPQFEQMVKSFKFTK